MEFKMDFQHETRNSKPVTHNLDHTMTEKPKILIIEDDEAIRTQMKWALAEEYEVLLAEDRPSALEIFRTE